MLQAFFAILCFCCKSLGEFPASFRQVSGKFSGMQQIQFYCSSKGKLLIWMKIGQVSGKFLFLLQIFENNLKKSERHLQAVLLPFSGGVSLDCHKPLPKYMLSRCKPGFTTNLGFANGNRLQFVRFSEIRTMLYNLYDFYIIRTIYGSYYFWSRTILI